MNWFRIDLKSGGSRFIETNFDFEGFKSLVADQRLIPVLRQVLPVPIQIRESALGEAVITTPGQGIVIPVSGRDG